MSSPPHTVRVDLPGREYDVLVGAGLLDQAGEHIAGLGLGKRCALVSDSTVAPLY